MLGTKEDKTMDEKYAQAIRSLSRDLHEILKNVPEEIQKNVREICIRVEKPIIFICKDDYLFLRKDGKLTRNINLPLKLATRQDIKNSIRAMCDNSVYSYDDEIKNGFLTLKGGHRVGLCGTAVLSNNIVVNVRDVSTLNIRIARQIKTSADEFFLTIKNKFNGIILAGAPASGKTTVLREIARKLSLSGKKVSVVDERNELSGTYDGVAQNDMGFCDILNRYPKSDGLLQAIRTLSPDVIVCDEIGAEQDILAVKQAVHAGVKLVVSVHAAEVRDFSKRRQCKELLSTEAFDVLAMMSGRSEPGKISEVYRVGEELDKISRCAAPGAVVGSLGACHSA